MENEPAIPQNTALLDVYKPTLLSRLSPTLTKFFHDGNRAESFLWIRAFALWRIHHLSESERESIRQFSHKSLHNFPNLTALVIEYFGLPAESRFDILFSGGHQSLRLFYTVKIHNAQWSVRAGLPTTVSVHEALEATLSLRDALRPILTATEIAEILAV